MSTARKKVSNLALGSHRISSTGGIGLLLWVVVFAPDSLVHQQRETNARLSRIEATRHVERVNIATNQLAKLP